MLCNSWLWRLQGMCFDAGKGLLIQGIGAIFLITPPFLIPRCCMTLKGLTFAHKYNNPVILLLVT